MIEIKENALDKETYLALREQVGWVKLSDRQASMAVNNCLFYV